MHALRSALVAAVCAFALAGTYLLFFDEPPPIGEDERAIAGRWTGPSISLELGTNGAYALVLGTAAAPVECGRWRVEAGTLQMRASRGAPRGSTLLLTQPGFRAGGIETDPASGRLVLSMQAALPGARTRREEWVLSRETAPEAPPVLHGCDD